jgi:Mor family transcriptional regulator
MATGFYTKILILQNTNKNIKISATEKATASYFALCSYVGQARSGLPQSRSAFAQLRNAKLFRRN